LRRLLVLAAVFAFTGLFRRDGGSPGGGSPDPDATIRLDIGGSPAANLTDATVQLRAHIDKVTAKTSSPPATASPDAAATPDAATTGQFTAADAAALRRYTSGAAFDMNAYLRGKLDPPPGPEWAAELQADIDRTSLALSHLPNHPGMTVRGVDHSDPDTATAPYQVGAVVTEQGFLSTTTDPSVADTAFSGNTIYVVTGETGTNIQPYSKHGFEQEVLYDYGTDFLVEARYTDPDTGQTIIEMTEVPRD
jgi:hypothetical protein